MTETKWPELPWDQVIDRVSPLVFRVYAGQSAGTAFIISCAPAKTSGRYSAILATALHVLTDAVQTGDNVTLVSADKSRVFDSSIDEMRIQELGSAVHDTAMILLLSDRPIVQQDQLLPMLPYEFMLPRGVEVGWLGFPGLVEPELCFFHGHISGYSSDPPMYLVDGVAIHGVSGCPAFDNRAHFIGLVSAYVPNVIDESTTLPGMSAIMPTNALRMFMQDFMKATVL